MVRYFLTQAWTVIDTVQQRVLNGFKWTFVGHSRRVSRVYNKRSPVNIINQVYQISAKFPARRHCKTHKSPDESPKSWRVVKGDTFFFFFLSLCMGNKVTGVHMHFCCTDVFHYTIPLSQSFLQKKWFSASQTYCLELCFTFVCGHLVDFRLIICY